MISYTRLFITINIIIPLFSHATYSVPCESGYALQGYGASYSSGYTSTYTSGSNPPIVQAINALANAISQRASVQWKRRMLTQGAGLIVALGVFGDSIRKGQIGKAILGTPIAYFGAKFVAYIFGKGLFEESEDVASLQERIRHIQRLAAYDCADDWRDACGNSVIDLAYAWHTILADECSTEDLELFDRVIVILDTGCSRG